MYYKIILVWILLFIHATPRTQLSKSKCPSMFYLTKANATTISQQQSKQMNQQFYSIYNNQYLKSSVQDIVINGNPKALSEFISSRMTVYIVLVSIFLVIFITAGICCLFQQSCPPSFMKRDLKKRPYTICQFRMVTLLTLLFTIGVIVPCFVGLSFLPQLKKDVQLTKCSLYIVLDAALNGEKQTGWGGFNNLYVKIQNVTQYLTESLPLMSLYLSGDQWLLEEMQNLKQMNLNIYRNNKQAKLFSPNPTTTKQALDNGLEYPMINSRFITQGLGPNGTANTMITDIDRGIRTTQVLSSLAYEIQVAAKRVLDSSDTLLLNTNSSLQSMNMYITQLQNLQTSINQFTQQYLSQLFTSIVKLLQATYSVSVIAGFCSLLGLVATYRYEIFKCKSLITLAWTLFGLGFIGSMIVLFFVWGMGSLGFGFCQYFQSMMTSQTQFNKLGQSYSQNPFIKLDACFYSDGNVLQKFNLGQQMNTVTNLFSLIQQYYNYENQLSTNYIDKNISVNKIVGWMVTMRNYQQGVYIDYDQRITTDDNPNYAIDRLNLYTKGGAGVPVCAKDRWVFDKDNCTLNNQTIYITGTEADGVALQTRNASICISFNEKFSTLMSSPWTASDFTRRYTQTRQACPFAYEKILDYGYSIIRFRDSRINLFLGIHDQLNSLYAKNLIFNNNLTTFKNKLLGFESSVSDLNNVVSNSLDGLLVSSNCGYIVDTLKFTYNSFCVNVMYNVVRIGYCSICIVVFSILGMITTYLFSIWFTDVQKNNKWFEEGYSAQDYVEALEISSQQVLKQQKQQIVDIGKDLQKLGHFNNYVLKSKQPQQKQKPGQQKKPPMIDSQESSQEENPYTKDIAE